MRNISLENYPLAVIYGWKANKITTGGSLYLYPPRAKYWGYTNGTHARMIVVDRYQLESINPDDLNPLAKKGAKLKYAI